MKRAWAERRLISMLLPLALLMGTTLMTQPGCMTERFKPLEPLEPRRMLAAQAYDWNSVTIKANGFIDGIVYHPAQADLVYIHTDMGGAYRWDQSDGKWSPLNDWSRWDDWPAQNLGVETMAVDPTDPNRVYMAAGTYMSPTAILRSTDQGRTWLRTDVGGINSNGNGSARNAGERMAVDPNSPNILYYGTRDDGLWRSFDYGATWGNVASFPTIGEDGGVEADTGIVWVLFDKSSATAGNATPTIYAGVVHYAAGANRIYRSTNGGSTWQAVPGGQPTTASYFPQRAALTPDGNTLYLTYGFSTDYPGPWGITEGMVWKASNPDAPTPAWADISPPVTYGFSGVAIDPTNPNTVHVTELGNYNPADRIWRSTNAGGNWSVISPNGNRDDSSAPYATSMRVHWMGDLQINPSDRNDAMFTTGYGLYRTTNFTAAEPAWTFFNEGFEQSAVLELASPNTGTVHLLSAIGDRDGYRHDDFSVSPAIGLHGQNNGLARGTSDDIDVAFNDANYAVRIVRASPWAQYSNDNGVTWAWFSGTNTAGSGSGGGNIAISADGTKAVYEPGGGGQVRYAMRTGSNWSNWTNPAANRPADGAKIVADLSAAQMFYAYAGTTVSRSIDGGANWTVMTTGAPSGGGWIRALPGQTGHLVMSRGGNGVWRSTDGGANWTRLNAGAVTTANQVGVGAGPTAGSYPSIFVGGTVNGLHGYHRSDDQGATWTLISDPSQQFGWVTVIQGDPRVHGRLYVGSNGRGILYGDIHGTPDALPAGWSTADIGSPASAGAAGESAGAWDLVGGGAGVGGTVDQFRFAYKELSGDGSITARVVDLSDGGPGNYDAKAGVMIRSSLSANSANAFVALTPGSIAGVQLQSRGSSGGATTTHATATTNVWPPYWIRLLRSGNQFTAYRSPDGVNWTLLGAPQTIGIGSTIYAGLAVTASDNRQVNVARFEQVSVVAATPPTAVIAPIAPDPRPDGVAAFTLTFSEPVSGVDLADLSISRDGFGVPLAGATLNSSDGGTTWTLAGTTDMTDEAGTYMIVLTAAGSGIVSGSSVALAENESESWSMNVVRATSADDAISLTGSGVLVDYRLGAALQYSFNPSLLAAVYLDGAGGEDQIAIDATHIRLARAAQIATGVSIVNGGSLDVGTGTLIVRNGEVGSWNGAAYTSLSGLIATDRIFSSPANATGGLHAVAVASASDVLDFSVQQTQWWRGLNVSAGDVLIRHTYDGDANLDGRINVDDYGQIDFNVGSSGSVFGYFIGDFNLDGKVNVDDYGIIDSNVGAQEGLLA